jgi:sigma-B regulation protein RsbU (phosphoserine phosphatase)
VKKLVNYHAFTVMLWNEPSQELENVFSMLYLDTIPPPVRTRLNQGTIGTAAAERRIVRVDDVRLNPRYLRCDNAASVGSELAIPLLLQNRLIGVLDLESTEPEAFTAEQERLLDILGSYIAVALENSRLFEEARENESRLQNDLDTAREIQQQLLPNGTHTMPGLDLASAYVPALSVPRGDWGLSQFRAPVSRTDRSANMKSLVSESKGDQSCI